MSAIDVNKKPTSSTFRFLKENVLSVTDLTRTNKLSEILNQYAGEETPEIYVIQNHKNRNAIGVLVDLEHYERLLKIQEAVEQSTDEIMYEIAMQRINEKANIPLGKVLDDSDFDFNELVKSLPNTKLDED